MVGIFPLMTILPLKGALTPYSPEPLVRVRALSGLNWLSFTCRGHTFAITISPLGTPTPEQTLVPLLAGGCVSSLKALVVALLSLKALVVALLLTPAELPMSCTVPPF